MARGQFSLTSIFIEHPLCTLGVGGMGRVLGLGLGEGSVDRLSGLSVPPPFPKFPPSVISPLPGRHSFSVLRPANVFSEISIPAFVELLALQTPPCCQAPK